MHNFRGLSLRDPRQDYAGPGTWFITIKCIDGRWVFGQVVDKIMRLNEIGAIADRFLRDIPLTFPTPVSLSTS